MVCMTHHKGSHREIKCDTKVIRKLQSEKDKTTVALLTVKQEMNNTEKGIGEWEERIVSQQSELTVHIEKHYASVVEKVDGMKRTALMSVKMLGSTERKEIKERMEDISEEDDFNKVRSAR